MLNKNSEHEITITGIAAEGEGVGRAGEMAVFVKGGLPGERVRVKIMKEKKCYAYGKLVKILDPSPDRAEPGCPAFGACGGCDLRHMAYGAQLRTKSKLVSDCLQRIGGIDIEVPLTLGMENPRHYRNKAQIPVGQGENGLIAGFYARRSHRIIPVTDCDLQHELTARIIETVLGFAERSHIPAYDEATHTGIMRHIVVRTGFSTGEIMVCLVINAQSLPAGKRNIERLISELRQIPGFKTLLLNVNTEMTNVVMGRRTINLYGPGKITERVGDIAYEISPLSFFQVNTAQTKKLFDTVVEFAGFTGNERVLDVYCGAGAISLYVARRVKEVRGVEAAAEAVRDAISNATLNGIENARFTEGLAEEILPGFQETFDTVILDPPEKGCKPEVIHAAARKNPAKIIYVSCNPATLARDMKIFAENGYAAERVQPVDMFPMTAHVETVAALRRSSG